MERGQTQRTQLDHELWKVVCQDTGVPLKLVGWEGKQCSDGLQNLYDQALTQLKHTLPDNQLRALDEPPGEQEDNDDGSRNPSSAAADTAANEPIVNLRYRVDLNNSAHQNLKEFAKFCTLHCGVQQPLCAKSMQTAITAMKAEKSHLERANQHYSNYLKIVEAAEKLRLLYKPEAALTPEQEVAKLKKKIAKRKEAIAAVKAVRRKVHDTTMVITRKTKHLQDRLSMLLQRLRDREMLRFRGSQIQQSLCTKIRVAQVKAFHLKRTNLFNDSFFIWHDGPYATINGNRLGKLPAAMGPQYQVEYGEINAAWGLAALLLHLIGSYHNAKCKEGRVRQLLYTFGAATHNVDHLTCI
mgnify:CR=1 FL=1